MSMSLTRMLNDPSLLFDDERLKKKIENAKKDKRGIVDAASEYNDRYREEVEEGTKKKQLLLTQGAQRGLEEKDIMKEYGQFLPTRQTPILNFLYFLMREENIDEDFEKLKMKYDKLYGNLREEYNYDNSGYLKDPEEIDKYIYGNCTLETFQKIKKLKRLSLSDNPNEAFLAYTICMELCKKYNLEFDKVRV